MNTYTFIENSKTIKFTVKKEFLQKCPNPENQNLNSLTIKYNIKDFIHNENGPAVEYLETIPSQALNVLNKVPGILNNKSYWLNGKMLIDKELEMFLTLIGK